MANKQFKQFTINNETDACVALGCLITAASTDLEKYIEYSNELNKLIDYYSDKDEEVIPATEYENIKDKLLFRQHELLRIIADMQDSSFSYYFLRKKVFTKFKLSTLSADIVADLDNLLDVRNWTFHNPQSMLVAAKEAAEKNIPDAMKKQIEVKPQLNPIIRAKAIGYELDLAVSLSIHTEERIEMYKRIIDSMIDDYQQLYDSIENEPIVMGSNGKVEIKVQEMVGRIISYHSDIAQISMAIQKSKYDGSQQSYDENVIR